MPVYIVAELSANHGGSLDCALRSIEAIARTGADAVKTQTYTADTITIDSDRPEFRIDSGTIWDGETLHDLYQEAHTPWEWHAEMKACAEASGLEFFSAPFDPTAVEFLQNLGVGRYKIASFEITDTALIRLVAATGKPVIISTGIADISDIDRAVACCREEGNNDITLLQCTSSYPAPPDRANLLMIPNLAETFAVKSGLSDHTLGTAVSVAAVSLGATLIEKHFTLDRDAGGPDSAFSMEPEEFHSLVQDIRIAERALGRIDYSLSAEKQKSRTFARSLYAVKDIAEGEPFTRDNVRSIRPGFGLHPMYLDRVLRTRARIALARGTPLAFEYLE